MLDVVDIDARCCLGAVRNIATTTGAHDPSSERRVHRQWHQLAIVHANSSVCSHTFALPAFECVLLVVQSALSDSMGSSFPPPGGPRRCETPRMPHGAQALASPESVMNFRESPCRAPVR